jgi:hypothetical protein
VTSKGASFRGSGESLSLFFYADFLVKKFSFVGRASACHAPQKMPEDDPHRAR